MRDAEALERCGMLVIYHKEHPNYGFAQCPRCGWYGIPTSIRGEIRTECPSCEHIGSDHRETDEEMWALGEPPKLIPKQGRNEPCACGSGKKFKKCCGA